VFRAGATGRRRRRADSYVCHSIDNICTDINPILDVITDMHTHTTLSCSLSAAGQSSAGSYSDLTHPARGVGCHVCCFVSSQSIWDNLFSKVNNNLFTAARAKAWCLLYTRKRLSSSLSHQFIHIIT
jgi:hypothetical protein